MSDLAAGVAFVDIEPKVSKGFEATLAAGLEPALKSIGTKMSAVGGSLSKVVTAPLLLIGGGLLKAGADIDSAFDTIRIKTGATGQVLTNLEKDFRGVASSGPESFDDVANAIATLHDRTGAVGPQLQALAGNLLTLSRITKTDVTTNIDDTSRAFAAWNIQLKDQPEALNKIFRASQATGTDITQLTETVQKFAIPLKELGFSFDSSLALVGKFNKEGVNTELTLRALQVSLAKTAKSGEDPVKALARITKEIKEAGTVSGANAKAIELFGARAGPQLAGAIRAGRLEVGDLIKSIKSGDTIEQAAAQTDDFAESFKTLKNNVIFAVEPIASKLFNALDKLAPKFAPIIGKLEDVVDWFAKLSPKTQEIIVIVAALAAALGPVLLILGPLVTAVGALLSPVGLVVAAIAGLAAIFVTAKVNGSGVGDVVSGIAKKIEADAPKIAAQGLKIAGDFIQGAAKALVDNVPKLTEKFIVIARAFLDWIKPLIGPALIQLGHWLGALGTWILDVGLPLLVRTLHRLGTAFVEWIKPNGPPLLRELGSLLGKLVVWIVTVALPTLILHIGKWEIAFIQWLSPSIVKLLRALPGLLLALGKWIVTVALPWIGKELLKLGIAFVEWIGPMIPKVLLALALLPLKIGEWLLTTAVPWVVTSLFHLAGAFVEWIIPTIPKVIVFLIQMFINIVEWVLGTAVPWIAKTMVNLATAFFSWLWDEIPKIPGQLEDLGKKIVDWVTAMPEKINKAAAAMFDGIKTAFKEAINYVIRGWNAISFETPKIEVAGKTIGGDKVTVPQIPELKALGGSVKAGNPYFVGERGIELEIPRYNGRIMSNAELRDLLTKPSAGGGAGVVIQQLNVPTRTEAKAEEVADAISRKIGWRVSLANPVR